MGVGFDLTLDVQLLDSMLLNILGGSEGDDLGALFASQSAKAVQNKIENKATSRRVKFVAHKPRGKNGTAVCTGLDGNTYAADDPDIPAIPQHFGCRSQYQFTGGALSSNSLTAPAPATVSQPTKSEKVSTKAKSKKKVAKKSPTKKVNKTEELRKKLAESKKKTAEMEKKLEATQKRVDKKQKELDDFEAQKNKARAVKAKAEKDLKSVKRSKTLDSIDPKVQAEKKKIIASLESIIKSAEELI